MKDLTRFSLKHLNQIPVDKKLSPVCDINCGGIFRSPEANGVPRAMKNKQQIKSDLVILVL